MKKLTFLTVFYSILIFIFSCKKNEIKVNPNKISFNYNNTTIVFDNIKIQEVYVDLNSGDRYRVSQIDKKDFGNGFNYYIIIDFKKDLQNNYIVHYVNFGITEIISSQLGINKVYFVDLNKGFNKTNFNHSSMTNNKKVTGLLSGKMNSISNDQITITDGKFELDFNTVKKY